MFNHTSLGKIEGVETGGVTKYLGVKYASLEHRFALPKLFESQDNGSVIDATKYGPSVPQPPVGCDMEFNFIQQALEKPPFEISETECLNLNIVVPNGLSADSKVPVLVWIHGGGFAIGANNWPQWDMTKLVQKSVELNTPIIGISINYRLGALGFLASKELDEAGIKANRGLRDQAMAFTWIKANIGGFGGDPDNVTAMGQSMGSASCTFHLHSKEPLFNKIIAQGGNSLALRPLPPAVPETVYQAVLGIFNLSDLSAEQRIEQLKSVPLGDILQKIPPNLPLVAVIDGDVVPYSMSFENLAANPPGKTWCKKMIVGDCALDAMITGEMFLSSRRKGIAKSFTTSIKKTFESKPKVAETIIAAYGINEESTDDDADFVKICQIGNDISYTSTSTAWAKAWVNGGEVYRYFFNQGNPWDGNWKGHASHILDAAYVFQTFNERLDDENKAVAQKMAKDFIAFLAGQPIKEDFKLDDLPCLVYGSCADIGTDEKTGRRTIISQISDEKLASLDELLAAWSAFVQGR